ncbi:NADAR family protein [Exiguobacterium sp. S22-S28]|uniref:NADAR family protein n=1 Tax=Exiguobacterium sp. S22-S28 TaxID=3342768 RepID=UPI00372D16DD
MTILFYGEKVGVYTGFSNFSNHGFYLDDYFWKTSEHFFQAQKFIGHPEYDYIRNLPTPKEAAYEGRKFTLRSDWKEVRYTIMKRGVTEKLRTHPDILVQLLETNMEKLVENNPKDSLWANGADGNGQNLFGQVLMDIRAEFRSIAILESEGSYKSVSVENLVKRHQLIEQLRTVPADMFRNLRHLQPQVGCFNRCSFCSQSAGSSIWYLNHEGLKNLFSALKTVAIDHANAHKTQQGIPYLREKLYLDENQKIHADVKLPKYGLLGYGRDTHRPGVLYCYLDNDISTYPHFDSYLKYAYEDLGVTIRISTVGYSRRNLPLQRMHEEINQTLGAAVAGVRLSLTPYTYGWTQSGERTKKTSRDDFQEDVENFLRTYRPLVNRLGTGQRTAGVELRFPPLSETRMPFLEVTIDGIHHMAVGPYLLRAKEKDILLETSKIEIDDDRKMRVIGEGKPYRLYDSDSLRCDDIEKLTAAIELHLSEKKYKDVQLYLFENEDGPYYVTDPEMSNDGVYTKHFYPATAKRQYSGYIDAERYFLNSLLKYKREKGIMLRRQPFTEATWSDVRYTLNKMLDESINYNNHTMHYVQNVMSPMVEMYATSLQSAGYPASFFYLSTFTIDTGSICNLGQAYYEFKDLASRPNLPLTPQHEKSYGESGSLGAEGAIWRMSVIPNAKEDARKKVTGERNLVSHDPRVLIEREDLGMRSLGGIEGNADSRFSFPMEGIEMMNFKTGMEEYLIMGQASNR